MKKILFILSSLLFLSPFVYSDFLNLSEIELVKYYGPTNLLIDIHLELWKWQQSNDKFSSHVSLLRELVQYADFDIVSYLSNSIDIDRSLQYVLDHLYQLLSKSNTAINNLDKSMSNLEQVKSDCDKSKELSDKNYSLALNDYDAQGMEKYLEDSIEYEHCSSDARINYNAYRKLKNQLSYYHGVLKTKYNYFLEHKYDISQNMARKVK